MIDIKYKQGKLIANADELSRIPMHTTTEISHELFSFCLIDNIPLSAADIAKTTQRFNIIKNN